MTEESYVTSSNVSYSRFFTAFRMTPPSAVNFTMMATVFRGHALYNFNLRYPHLTTLGSMSPERVVY